MGYAARTSGERPREVTQRRFKEAAATAIDQHAGVIGQLVDAINQTNESARVSREFVADLSARIDANLEAANLFTRNQSAFVLNTLVRDSEPLRRPFLGRLRWLLTGK